ncbi:MAG TPA: alpha-E domain-containing protein [Polyangiaceae bacterium]
MLSRVADAVYWMSRYVERAENVARFVDVNLHLMLDLPSGQRPNWESLVLTTGDHRWFIERYGDATPEAVTRFLTFDKEYPNSILSSVSWARENARTIREIISREMWQQLNEFYWMVVGASEGAGHPGEMSDFYAKVKLSGIYFEGVTNATLSRGDAWHFAHLGRMLERADKTSRIVDVKYFTLLPTVRDVGTTLDQLGWAALLNSASALQMYRQMHHVTTPAQVAQFLLLDRDFPRSIHRCVIEAQSSLHALTGTPLGSHRLEAERLMGELRSLLDYARIQQIMESGLHEYLDDLQVSVNEIGVTLERMFFHVEL